ncbi:hypothetical protein BP00DRAFT_55670 [Aspergillus indologenus CBS 114.80]|uniref:Uncharacterized protein n=1 Tax=Aspergillus indologenus CBS 114.80 TaxID=1450541 RepID=A0A2V5ID39_9EURO|nr:hypothetical protein BP00DRAFT_55670 [Aspergillus indologenus CBS 114.80]
MIGGQATAADAASEVRAFLPPESCELSSERSPTPKPHPQNRTTITIMYIAASARWLCFLTWICAVIHPASAKDAPTVIASMDNLRQSVDSAQAVFDSYDGGWMASWDLARAVWDVYAQTKSARGQWDSAPAFKDDEVPDILVAYHSMRQSIADTLGAAGSKVCAQPPLSPPRRV